MKSFLTFYSLLGVSSNCCHKKPRWVRTENFLLPFGSFLHSLIELLNSSLDNLSTPFWEFPVDVCIVVERLLSGLSTPFWEFRNIERLLSLLGSCFTTFYSLLGVSRVKVFKVVKDKKALKLSTPFWEFLMRFNNLCSCQAM